MSRATSSLSKLRTCRAERKRGRYVATPLRKLSDGSPVRFTASNLACSSRWLSAARCLSWADDEKTNDVERDEVLLQMDSRGKKSETVREEKEFFNHCLKKNDLKRHARTLSGDATGLPLLARKSPIENRRNSCSKGAKVTLLN